MNKTFFLACIPIVSLFNAMPTIGFAAGTAVPCEQMLSDVRAALKSANLTDANKAKVADLEQKGVERCKADDDTRADAFFTQALALMGK